MPTEAQQIDAYLKARNSPLAGYGRVFANAARQAGISPYLLPSIAGMESSFGVAGPGPAKNNAWGWMDNSHNLMRFNSWPAAIRYISRTFGQRGWTDPAQFAATYAPPSDGNDTERWIKTVQEFMAGMGGAPAGGDVAPAPGVTVDPGAPAEPPKVSNVPPGKIPLTQAIPAAYQMAEALVSGNTAGIAEAYASLLPPVPKAVAPKVEMSAEANGQIVKNTMELIKEYMGTPYRMASAGGRSDFTNPTEFDCSGFVNFLYQQATGKPIVKGAVSTATMWPRGKKIPLNKLQFGDAIFWGDPAKAGGAAHMGMYLGNDRFVHASSNGGVKISILSEYGRTPVGARRYL